MGADRADLGGGLAGVDVAAVAADPDVLPVGLPEHQILLQVLQQSQITLLVLLLDGGDAVKESGNAL